MHGRLKIRTSEEQKLIKEKEQQRKLEAYRSGLQKILASRKNEGYDQDCFMLCGQLLSLNPDITTLWNYRKEVVLHEKQSKNDEELTNFLDSEVKLTENCLLVNPKSYGSWHHRYWVLEHHPKPNWKKELELCTKYLTMDDRNFHCWDYRRLILGKVHVSLIEELKFSTERINVNFSNYSSWHYRSTLRNLDESCLDDEINLIQNAIFTDPADSSAWFYLRWVLNNSAVDKERKEKLLEALDQLLDMEPDCKWAIIAKCWLIESLDLDKDTVVDNRKWSFAKLVELDPLRSNYYNDILAHPKRLD